MKFEEIYIDGFGIFHDYHIKNLTSGLTIFIGPNEAGKSTILSFQKRILFGFPDRRSKLNLYPPLAGGNHGGRLIVSADDNTRYIIERYSKGANDVKVILPDGSTGGTTELSNLLGHANKDIFENIYAFGLTELQDFETLNSEAVKERIYSAGAGIGAISLSEVQKNLETEAGKLFKKRGSKPEINALFNEIKNIDSMLREIKKDTQNFDKLHKELEEITMEIANVEQKRNQIRTKFNHTTNLITVWDDWRKIQEAKEHLQKIPEIENFPESGIEMLERNLEKIDELNENISEKNERLEKNKIQKIPKWDKGVSCPYFHILYAHINYFALPSP
ncbi:MAG: AAA family ATPase, partial [Methanophagales archaeon]|nr:AAA family ATPase [Methanophagales archaeon]